MKFRYNLKSFIFIGAKGVHANYKVDIRVDYVDHSNINNNNYDNSYYKTLNIQKYNTINGNKFHIDTQKNHKFDEETACYEDLVLAPLDFG